MTKEYKGKSQFAMLADALPVRARACLAILAAEVALPHLRQSPDLELVRAPLNFALTWHRGETVDMDDWEKLLEAEESSPLFAETRAHSKEESLAWCVFDNAMAYVAFLALRAANRSPWSSLDNMDERALDELDENLRTLEPSSIPLMSRAAAYLARRPDAIPAQVKRQLSS